MMFSQFKEGYIINNNNDTIRGLINWEGSIINSSKCEFKINTGDESKIYKPGDILGFRFNNSKFFSSKDIITDNQEQKVFIEWLIKGRASLLSFSGSVPYTKYFILAEDGTISELLNTTAQIVQENVVYERKKKEYISTLMYSFRDCQSLQPKINSASFNSKSLINITKQYHELTCKEEDCVIFEEKDRKMKVDWGIYTAFLNSNLKINNGDAEKMYPANSVGVGIALNITNLPGLSPKFSLKINPAFFSSMYRYDTSNVAALKTALQYHLIKDDRVCKIGFAKVPVQLSYRFNQKKFSPFVSAGGTVNLRFSYKQYDKFLTDWITLSGGDSFDSKLSFLQLGINSGIGFDYLASPTLRINVGYDFEYASQLYGSYADDHSKIMNNIVYLRAYFF